MATLTLLKTKSTFLIPARDLLAVYNAISTDQGRYYLGGVFIEAIDDAVNMVATDGHIMLKKIATEGSYIGADVSTQGDSDSHARGFIINTDIMEKAFKAKTIGDLWIYGDITTGILQFVDVEQAGQSVVTRVGVCEFERIDGTFPDYTRVLPNFDAEANTTPNINPDLFMKLAKAGRVLSNHKTFAMKLLAAGEGNPIAVSFNQVPSLQGVIMPIRF